MSNIKKANKYEVIFLVLFYALGIQIITQSALLVKIDEIQNSNITNIDMFLFIINILIVILSVLFIFLQSTLYKIFLTFFQFEKDISFMRNFSHLLKGTIPLVIVILIFEFLGNGRNAFEFLNLTVVNILITIITNTIYVFFLKKDLEMNLSKTFTLGVMLVVINLIFITLGKLVMSL